MSASARALLDAGNLEDSLAELQEQVRNDPGNPKLRIFLFQLLAVLGEWERALTQLTIAGDLDQKNALLVPVYREVLHCEALRTEIFRGERTPLVFGEPDPWIALLIEALNMTAQQKHAEAQELRQQAFESAPEISGTIHVAAPQQEGSLPPEGDGSSGKPVEEWPPADVDSGDKFEWIADMDTRLGPILEAIVNGRYFWIPFPRIREIQISEPTDLRDTVWMPARFQWVNEGEAVGMIPSRYVGSETHSDPLIRMARKTEFSELQDGLLLGMGQRMLATEAGEYPLMDIRMIRLETQAQQTVDNDVLPEGI